MPKEWINKSVLLALVFLISCLFLTMIEQFLLPLFMAGLFSATLKPAHRLLTQKMRGRKNLASVLVIIGIVLLFLIPLGLLIGVVAGQAITISQSISPWVQAFIEEPSSINKYLQKLPYYQEIIPYRAVIVEKMGMLVGTVSSFFIDSLSSVTKMTANAFFNAVIMLYAMFFFLSTGEALLHKIMYYLPLNDRDERLLLLRFTSVTKATLKGTLIIGALQGLICGLAFSLAGIQGAVFWGTIMAVTSIIPVFGASLVWIPAIVVLASQGDFIGVGILVICCGLVAGNLDNFLRPRLVGKDTKMHDLFVLFGTMGGIGMFGILGIIIGPIIAALFITSWEIYGTAFAHWLPLVHTPSSLENTIDTGINTGISEAELADRKGSRGDGRGVSSEAALGKTTTKAAEIEDLIRDMQRRA